MQHEYDTRHRADPWNASIQEFYNRHGDLAIVCMTQKQAEIFGKIQYFQVDMTFKRISGPVKEVIFSHFDQTINRGRWSHPDISSRAPEQLTDF
jgi:hypothetical protein